MKKSMEYAIAFAVLLLLSFLAFVYTQPLTTDNYPENNPAPTNIHPATGFGIILLIIAGVCAYYSIRERKKEKVTAAQNSKNCKP